MNAFFLTLLGALIISSNIAYGIDQTAVVAAKLGYPKEIVVLRSEADDFLRDLRIGMSLGVHDLRSKNLELRADEMTLLSNDAYFALEKEIDDAFEDISRQFVRGANKLDDDEASFNEKAFFINRMKVLAQQKIDGLLKRKATIPLK